MNQVISLGLFGIAFLLVLVLGIIVVKISRILKGLKKVKDRLQMLVWGKEDAESGFPIQVVLSDLIEKIKSWKVYVHWDRDEGNKEDIEERLSDEKDQGV